MFVEFVHEFFSLDQFVKPVLLLHLAVRKYDEEYEQPDEHNPVRKAPGRSRHLRRHDGLGPT